MDPLTHRSLGEALRRRDTARTMSRENVAITWQVVEAVNGRDVETLEALSDPAMEFHSVMAAVEGDMRVGPSTWAPYLESMAEAWGDWRIESPRVVDAENEQVVLLYTLVGTGRAGGVPIEHPVGVAVRIEQGRIRHVQGFTSHAEALGAVGLSE